MWGSSWSVGVGALALVAVLLASVLTAWSPIFAIVIVLALIPIAAAAVVARRAAEEPGAAPTSDWEAEHGDVGPEHVVRVEDGMVSDRRRASSG